MVSDKSGWLNKVPEITLFFWIIKILCTTVGETAADFLNVNLNLGLTVTSIVMGVLLVISLFVQFKSKKYVPAVYWLAVFLISIFGTLVTDNLTDSMGVPLELSTIVFSVLLAATFAVWYAQEKTLSIYSINTAKRESFYWLAILFTFALGTAAGDLMAESLGLGYLLTGIIVLALSICIIVAWKLGLDAVLAFWLVYILTRPLGASLGDYLSQSPANGGLGLGPTVTTVVFVLAIIVTVIYLAITKKDQITKPVKQVTTPQSSVFWQVAVVVLLLAIVAGAGYAFRRNTLDAAAPVSVSSDAPLGDVSAFRTITEDTLSLVRANNAADAKSRIGDLEFAWDEAEARMRPMSSKDWTSVDKAIDKALRNVRSVHPDAQASEASLVALLDTLDSLGKETPAGQ